MTKILLSIFFRLNFVRTRPEICLLDRAAKKSLVYKIYYSINCWCACFNLVKFSPTHGTICSHGALLWSRRFVALTRLCDREYNLKATTRRDHKSLKGRPNRSVFIFILKTFHCILYWLQGVHESTKISLSLNTHSSNLWNSLFCKRVYCNFKIYVPF